MIENLRQIIESAEGDRIESILGHVINSCRKRCHMPTTMLLLLACAWFFPCFTCLLLWLGSHPYSSSKLGNSRCSGNMWSACAGITLFGGTLIVAHYLCHILFKYIRQLTLPHVMYISAIPGNEFVRLFLPYGCSIIFADWLALLPVMNCAEHPALIRPAVLKAGITKI